MKALYAKPGKGKIHPSPPPPPPPPPAGGDPAEAALRLLPAAILALTAALRPEDQQVLAYLVTRSLHGAAPPPKPRRPHPPAIGCGCFDCYTSFWSRWDCSPDRELIHVAIDAFEEHLAAAESNAAPSTPTKRRDKGKRKPPPLPPPPPSTPRGAEPEPKLEKVQEASPTPAPAAAADSDDEKASDASSSCEEKGAEAEGGGEVVEEEERKRGWPDVMGLLNLRLWGIWSPAVESAT